MSFYDDSSSDDEWDISVEEDIAMILGLHVNKRHVCKVVLKEIFIV
jgi:hypothetical protein